MNIPKEAIEKAIEGGWHSEYPDCQILTHSSWYLMVGSSRLSCKGTPLSTVALDPTFWQSLGKSLMWTEKTLVYEDDDMEDGTNDVWQKTWLFNAHRFYDLVLEGKDTDDFWQKLLAANI